MADQYIYRPNRRADMRMWCGFCQDWFPIDDLPRISIKNDADQMRRMLDCAVRGRRLLD